MSVEDSKLKLSRMKSLGDVIGEHRDDEEFRKEWDRNAVARDIAICVVRYRTTNGLSQRDLARKVGMAQPAIARLESGEHQPSFDTLVKLTAHTGLEFHIDVARGSVELVSA